ncbi:MAG TPA: glycosyltransferase family A protein [Bryobacteraceae bacterium]|nr:glycosyltransferase family A protein [Bryobacteraceae bacterium]
MTRYVIITPARDEERHIEATIASVLSQTVLPAKWVIVNDGSADRTGQIIDRSAAQFPFIHPLHRRNRGFRKAGGGVMESFHEGYAAIGSDDWDFVVKLDGDLSFGPTYFQDCFERFEQMPDLGIAGGGIYHEMDGTAVLEPSPKFHVRGATKIYRRACWEAIGGLWNDRGWDTIDEVTANMLGWKTQSFNELQVMHHRFTGTSEGLVNNCVKFGAVCYICRYHPVYFLASCFYRTVRRPYLIGSLAMMTGMVKSYVGRVPRVDDKDFIKYIRRQQMRRLLGMETVWR